MSLLDQFFTLSLLIQIIHAIEELATGFHKKWYLFKMPFWVFLLFEIIFEGFWISVFLFQNFPNRQAFQTFFLVVMFANGVQHLVWSGSVKKYVPGLVTATLHILVFLAYYFKAIF
jgi:hypothetical protein